MPDPKHERTHRLITKGLPLDLLPTEQDLERVDEMNPCDCPRRYCWHWKTLSLDWDTPVAEGCDAHYRGLNHKGDLIPAMHDTPCKRLDPSNPKDHFEPREPAMLEDGIPEGRWDCGDFKQRRTINNLSNIVAMSHPLCFSQYFNDPEQHIDRRDTSYLQLAELACEDVARLLATHPDQKFAKSEIYPHAERMADPYLLHQTLNLRDSLELNADIADFQRNQLYPFAIDDFGNYYCISVSSGGSVIFYDHESGSINTIAANLRHFFESCIIPK